MTESIWDSLRPKGKKDNPASPPDVTSPSEAGPSPPAPTAAPTAQPVPVSRPSPARPPAQELAEVALFHGPERTTGGLSVSGLLTPLARVDQAVAAWNLFSQLKEKLLSKEDYYLAAGTLHPNRTGWRKLATFFGLSSPEIVEERRWERADDWGFDFVARVVAPNGQQMVGVGSCSAKEVIAAKMPATVHNVRSKAHTRALNRAISDLIGGGELSAEEGE